jgi:hypothetical protein
MQFAMSLTSGTLSLFGQPTELDLSETEKLRKEQSDFRSFSSLCYVEGFVTSDLR